MTYDNTLDERRSQIIEDTLASFGAPDKVVEVNRGPTITQFGVEPDFVESRAGRTRVRVGKIAALADDLARLPWPCSRPSGGRLWLRLTSPHGLYQNLS